MIRMIFSTVRAPQEPAFTVESFAIRAAGRPSIVAVPVMTPSAGSPSASTLANAPSSVKLPSSASSAIRSRANSLPAAAAASWYLAVPPCSIRARTAASSGCPRPPGSGGAALDACVTVASVRQRAGGAPRPAGGRGRGARARTQPGPRPGVPSRGRLARSQRGGEDDAPGARLGEALLPGRDAEDDLVIAPARADVDAGRVVIDVGVGVRLGALEDPGVVHGPPGGVAHGPRRPLAAAAVLVAAELGARRLAGDVLPAIVDPQGAGAGDGMGAARRDAAVLTDLLGRVAGRRVDIHRQVGPVDHADVVEVQIVPGVQVVLGQRRGDRTVARALEPAVAVTGRAVAAAAVKDAPGAPPEPPVPVIGDGDGDAVAGPQHPAGAGDRMAGVRRGGHPDRLPDLVHEDHLARAVRYGATRLRVRADRRLHVRDRDQARASADT